MYISTCESMYTCTARGTTALASASSQWLLLDSPTGHEAEQMLQPHVATDQQPPTAAAELSAFSEQPDAVDGAGVGSNVLEFDDDDNAAQPLELPSPSPPPPPLVLEDGGRISARISAQEAHAQKQEAARVAVAEHERLQEEAEAQKPAAAEAAGSSGAGTGDAGDEKKTAPDVQKMMSLH